MNASVSQLSLYKQDHKNVSKSIGTLLRFFFLLEFGKIYQRSKYEMSIWCRSTAIVNIHNFKVFFYFLRAPFNFALWRRTAHSLSLFLCFHSFSRNSGAIFNGVLLPLLLIMDLGKHFNGCGYACVHATHSKPQRLFDNVDLLLLLYVFSKTLYAHIKGTKKKERKANHRHKWLKMSASEKENEYKME